MPPKGPIPPKLPELIPPRGPTPLPPKLPELIPPRGPAPIPPKLPTPLLTILSAKATPCAAPCLAPSITPLGPCAANPSKAPIEISIQNLCRIIVNPLQRFSVAFYHDAFSMPQKKCRIPMLIFRVEQCVLCAMFLQTIYEMLQRISDRLHTDYGTASTSRRWRSPFSELSQWWLTAYRADQSNKNHTEEFHFIRTDSEREVNDLRAEQRLWFIGHSVDPFIYEYRRTFGARRQIPSGCGMHREKLVQCTSKIDGMERDCVEPHNASIMRGYKWAPKYCRWPLNAVLQVRERTPKKCEFFPPVFLGILFFCSSFCFDWNKYAVLEWAHFVNIFLLRRSGRKPPINDWIWCYFSLFFFSLGFFISIKMVFHFLNRNPFHRNKFYCFWAAAVRVPLCGVVSFITKSGTSLTCWMLMWVSE